MTERNKISLELFGKLAVLFVWGIVTIITFAGVLNYNPEAFVKWCAGITLAFNGTAIFLLAKKFLKERNDKLVKIQEAEREALVQQANNKKKNTK